MIEARYSWLSWASWCHQDSLDDLVDICKYSRRCYRKNVESVLTFLRARDDVLQEVDGDRLICWQVHAHVDGEEVVALPLRLVLRLEGLHVHLLLLNLIHNFYFLL